MTIEHVGVAGMGLLGRGIVACLLGHGLRVTAFDVSADARRRMRELIPEALGELVARAGYPRAILDGWESRYREAEACEAVGPCDFAIETVIEDLAAKRDVYQRLERSLAADTPIGINTSAIPISIVQAGTLHPGRFVGLHWFQPAYATRFLEVIRGERTDDRTFEAAVALGRAVGKEPSLVQKDIRGFVANRIGYAMLREALHLLERGVADLETIDAALRNTIGWWSGFAGPFRVMDLAGVAPHAAVMEDLFRELSNATEVPAIIRGLVERGENGVRNGKGFHAYTPDESRAWEDLYTRYVWEVRELTERYKKEQPASPARSREELGLAGA